MNPTLVLIKNCQLADSDSKNEQNRLEINTEISDSPTTGNRTGNVNL